MDTKSNQALLSLDGEEFIRAAYKAILSRPADIGGLRSYLEWMRKGKTKEDILFSILASDEAQSRRLKSVPVRFDAIEADRLLSLPNDTQFIRAVYYLLLGRTVDETELNYFQNSLWNCTLDRVDILMALMDSAEGKKNGTKVTGFAKRRVTRKIRNLIYKIPLLGKGICFVRTQRYLNKTINQRLAVINQRLDQLERQGELHALEGRVDALERCSNALNESALTEEERKLYQLLNGGVKECE